MPVDNDIERKVQEPLKLPLSAIAKECGRTYQSMYEYIRRVFKAPWTQLMMSEREKIIRKYYLMSLGFNIPITALESTTRLQECGQMLIEGFGKFLEQCASDGNYAAIANKLTPATIEAMVGMNLTPKKRKGIENLKKFVQDNVDDKSIDTLLGLDDVQL